MITKMELKKLNDEGLRALIVDCMVRASQNLEEPDYANKNIDLALSAAQELKSREIIHKLS